MEPCSSAEMRLDNSDSAISQTLVLLPTCLSYHCLPVPTLCVCVCCCSSFRRYATVVLTDSSTHHRVPLYWYSDPGLSTDSTQLYINSQCVSASVSTTISTVVYKHVLGLKVSQHTICVISIPNNMQFLPSHAQVRTCMVREAFMITSASYLAEILVRSPRKLFIYII